ncbi:hypothetical protein [Streptomyces kaempferi]|uniref:Uncharacterized protein n=1 Tax=Streptomyces kaempferi TaxID=333725 RepID=A0ABW3XVA2_9ACTN
MGRHVGTRRLFHGGACGFLLKDSGPALLVEAIRAAVSGEALVSPSITVRLLENLRNRATARQVVQNTLSGREVEMVRLEQCSGLVDRLRVGCLVKRGGRTFPSDRLMVTE